MPNMDIMQFIGNLRNGNPEEMVMNMLQNSASGNPVLENLVNLAKNKDSAQIEAVARNLAKERGVDYDKEFNSFKRMFGL